MCFCGEAPEISNLWTGENAGRRWERCVTRKCAYFVWLDEPLKGRALEAVEELYTEMSMRQYDMKQNMWAMYQESLAKIRARVVEKARELEDAVNREWIFPN